ncbi:c-type cytochrome [beta proteobacterium MWH-UniP1]
MHFLSVLMLSVGLAASSAAASESLTPVAARAQTCVSCHGASGLGSDLAPAIAGQDQHRLRSKLFAYKYRPGAPSLMVEEARRLSDREIEELAALFSSPEHLVSRP